MIRQFNHVVVGGTFDHLHDGHKKLIEKAILIGTSVTIGVTSDAFVKYKVLSESIETFEERAKGVRAYLDENSYRNKVKLIRLNDDYGIAITEKKINAIVVSRETYSNARKINSIRRTRSMPQLKIVLVQLVKGNTKKIIRSEKIRRGEIDRHGNLFINQLTKKLKYHLPVYLRQELRKPLGRVFKTITGVKNTIEGPILVITVGDIITTSLISAGLNPAIQIIDFKSQRKKNTSVNIPKGAIPYRAINSPGTISKTASKAIEKAIHAYLITKKTQYVTIMGEEDLTALVAILLAPLGSRVIYGHFELGIVAVDVTEESKEKVRSVINKFK